MMPTAVHLLCSKCNLPVSRHEHMDCTECSDILHLDCAEVDRSDFLDMTARNINRWVCPTCKADDTIGRNVIDSDDDTEEEEQEHQIVYRNFYPLTFEELEARNNSGASRPPAVLSVVTHVPIRSYHGGATSSNVEENSGDTVEDKETSPGSQPKPDGDPTQKLDNAEGEENAEK